MKTITGKSFEEKWAAQETELSHKSPPVHFMFQSNIPIQSPSSPIISKVHSNPYNLVQLVSLSPLLRQHGLQLRKKCIIKKYTQLHKVGGKRRGTRESPLVQPIRSQSHTIPCYKNSRCYAYTVAYSTASGLYNSLYTLRVPTRN